MLTKNMLYERSELLGRMQAAKGAPIVVEGAGVTAWHVRGRFTAVVSTGMSTLWPLGTIYPFVVSLPTAQALEVLSDSALDTNTAGTGARTVKITGLDANWNEITEIVPMNGTTAVPTAAPFLRVNRFEVATAGVLASEVSGSNAGTINLRLLTAGATVGRILPNEGLAGTAVFSVPANKRAYLLGLECTKGVTTANAIALHVYQRFNGVLLQRLSLLASASALPRVSLQLPRMFLPKTDIDFRAIANAASDVAVEAEFALETIVP